MLATCAGNILNDPSNVQKRKLKTTDQKVLDGVMKPKGALGMMFIMGFTRFEDDLVAANDISLSALKSVFRVLPARTHALRQEWEKREMEMTEVVLDASNHEQDLLIFSRALSSLGDDDFKSVERPFCPLLEERKREYAEYVWYKVEGRESSAELRGTIACALQFGAIQTATSTHLASAQDAVVSKIFKSAINPAVQKVVVRNKDSDFPLSHLLRARLLSIASERKTRLGHADVPLEMPSEEKVKIDAALRSFRYWCDEPDASKSSGGDLCFWSENHAILFMHMEYLGILRPLAFCCSAYCPALLAF
jgi:hypothetical protein